MIPETSVDWKAFEYKYSDNPQRAFENLTYYLFCHEFHLPNGIFRYFNQPHIETNPIQVEQKLIGFQSKYYSDSVALSSKESDLTKAVRGAAERYPGITTLYFYISREFSLSSKKDELKPAYQLNIENAAQKLGISIEWKVRSNIEAQLVQDNQLASCRNLFFQTNSAVQKCCETLNDYRHYLFDHVDTDIPYQNHHIVIEQPPLHLDSFLQSDYHILLVDGAAGSGKSALIKRAIGQLGDEVALLAFKSTDLDDKDLFCFSAKLGDLKLNDILDIYKEADTRILYIDAAEKYFVLKNQQTFEDVLRTFRNTGWKVVLTIRSAYMESFQNLLLNQDRVQTHHIPPIDQVTLLKLSNTYGFKLPSDNKLRDLLSAPFYLRMYLGLDHLAEDEIPSLSMEAFESKIWGSIIRCDKMRRDNLPTRREHALINMTRAMLCNESYFYEKQIDDDSEAFSELEQSGVIFQTDDARSYCHSHDVFEELAAGRLFRKRYEDHVEESRFFDGFQPSLRTRKLFRGWLSSFAGIEEHQNIIFRLLAEEHGSQIWKDEIILALISTEALKEAFGRLTAGMGDDQSEMLKRIAFLVNTCCRKAYHEELFLQQGILFPYRLSTPAGYAWKALFTYIVEHMATLSWDGALISVVIDLLESWTRHKENAKTETTEIAGKIGLFLLDKLQSDQELHYIPRDEQTKTLCTVLLNAAWMIKEPLGAILQTVQDALKAEEGLTDDEYYDPHFIRTCSISRTDVPTLYMDLAECVVSDITQCGNAPSALPETTIQLMNALWTRRSQDPHYDSLETDGDFGLANHISYEYRSSSAYKTPIMILLQEHSAITIDFLIEFLNFAGESYYHSRLNSKYSECFTVAVQIGDKTIKQIASDRLWKMHRGTHVGPDLLISLLMGFELWLLTMLKEWEPQIATTFCKNLIAKSNNVMLTSLVVSVVEAYPEKLFELICILLKTKEFFHLDASRLIAEHTAPFLLFDKSWFAKERQKSNELPHRKKSLESVILSCQTDRNWISREDYNELRQQLYEALDVATVDIDNWNTEDKYAYYRIDLRHYREVIESKKDENGHEIYMVAPDYSEDMKELRKQSQDAYDEFYKFFDLQMWSEYRFTANQKYKSIEKYSNPKVACQELRELCQILNSITGNEETADDVIRSDMHRYISTVAYTSAVLLRDFQQELEDTDVDLCTTLIFDLGCFLIQESPFSFSQVGNGLEAVITGLVLLSNEENRKQASDGNPLVLLLKLVLRDWSQDSRVIKQIADTIWKHNKLYGWILLRLFSLLADKYEKEALIDRSLSVNAFIEAHKGIVHEALQNDSVYVPDIDFSMLSDATLFTITALVPAYTEEAFIIAEATKDTAMELSFAEKENGRANRQSYRDLIGYSMNYVVWLADVLLHCQDEERRTLISSFLAKADFQRSDNVEYFLKCLISKQDECKKVNEFWYIWELLKPRMIQLGQEKERYYYSSAGYPVGNDRIITTYLFANTLWRTDIHRCTLLSEERAAFFDDFVAKSNNIMAMLYALSYLLYTVGKEPYKDNGINWIYQLVTSTSNCKGTLYNNTLFYMEEYVGAYFSRHRIEFRTNRVLTQKTQAVLEYMLNQGSPTAFFIREQI